MLKKFVKNGKKVKNKDMYYAMDEENLIKEFIFYSTKLEKSIN